MAKKYRLTFNLVDTEDEAKRLCAELYKKASYYVQKHHTPHYTQWSSKDGTERAFLVWSVY